MNTNNVAEVKIDTKGNRASRIDSDIIGFYNNDRKVGGELGETMNYDIKRLYVHK